MSLTSSASLQARTLKLRRLALILSLIFLAAFPLQNFSGHAARTKLIPGDKSSAQRSSLHEPDGQTRSRINEAYGKLPLSFEANRGQVSAHASFLSRGAGYTLFLTPGEAMLSLLKKDSDKAANKDDARIEPSLVASGTLRWKLVDANSSPVVEGINELTGKSNYFTGRDARAWRTNVPNYERVKYESIYPGVDLVYYGNQQQLEYDFIVAPGAHPERIKMDFKGAQSVRLDAKGDLVLRVGDSDVRQHKPSVYQEINGRRKEITGRYRLDKNGQVGFEIGKYDRSQPLVIDPVLLYSTYLGGSSNDAALGVVVDAQGSAYISGQTLSNNFPVSNAIQITRGGLTDAFVVKLNPSGTTKLFSTYLGGSSSDRGFGIAVDAGGNAYVTGRTFSDNFPVTNGALQTSLPGVSSAFISKLNSDGSALLYSTYLGGDQYDFASRIAVDASGSAYVTGYATSKHVPLAGVLNGRQGFSAFKSLDGGGNWTGGDDGLYFDVLSLTIDPTNSNKIYAGTVNGVYRTVNGGTSWSILGPPNTPTSPNRPSYAYDVAVDPSRPDTIYAATSDIVDKSTDGGNTWAIKSAGFNEVGVTSIIIDPVSPSTLYANSYDGIYKSIDGGENWKQIINGLSIPSIGDTPYVTKLAFDPNNSSTIYAATEYEGVFKSTNGGNSWSAINNGLPITSPNQYLSLFSLAVDPLNSNNLYIGSDTYNASLLYKSNNGGSSWSGSDAGLPKRSDFPNSYLSVNALAVNPATPSIVYAGLSVGGVYKSADGGATWSAANTNLVSHTVNALAINRTNPATVYAAGDSGADAFVAKLNPGGSALSYFRYLGGGEDDYAEDIAVDAAGNSYVTGTTESTDFPVVSALQSANAGAPDGFVTKLNASGATILYSTYLGGTGVEDGEGLAVNANGEAYLAGSTSSYNFPVVNAVQPQLAISGYGYPDGYIAKLNSNGSSLAYSTYLGGGDYDDCYDVAVDADGSAYVTGYTDSVDFPNVGNSLAPTHRSSDAFLTKLNPSGSGFVFSSFIGGSNSEAGTAIAVGSSGDVYVVGETLSTDFPTVNAVQPVKASANSGSDAFIAKASVPGITVPLEVRFSASAYEANEKDKFKTFTVTRTGDLSAPATVRYATQNGAVDNSPVTPAVDTSDYTAALGTLRFAPGETVKTFNVFIADDAFSEPQEYFSVVLSDPTGASLGTPAAAIVVINNDPAATGPNPIAGASFNPSFFVRQHYIDFLNREPDASGLAFWTNQLTECGSDQQCLEIRRINVSAAFFLSIEFQQTGYFVYRLHQASFNSGPLLRIRDFLPDTQEIGRGVIVGQAGYEQTLEANKQAFINEFVTRPAFTALYPQSLTAAQYVDALNVNTGGSLTTAERDALVSDLTNNVKTRAQVLRAVAENQKFTQREFNRAFVLTQYFGYLRRNPNDAPDTNLNGYNFWLGKLNEFNGNFINAEMVKAFITSNEYKQRFGN